VPSSHDAKLLRDSVSAGPTLSVSPCDRCKWNSSVMSSRLSEFAELVAWWVWHPDPFRGTSSKDAHGTTVADEMHRSNDYQDDSSTPVDIHQPFSVLPFGPNIGSHAEWLRQERGKRSCRECKMPRSGAKVRGFIHCATKQAGHRMKAICEYTNSQTREEKSRARINR
jgi:hypothetical protein